MALKLDWRIVAASIVVLLALSFLFIARSSWFEDPIHIAVVGPMSGEYQWVGEAYVNATHMRFSIANENGGIDGRPVVLDLYDDQGDPTIARQIAEQIRTENRALAVIGHWQSEASIAAGDLYKSMGLAAVSPGSNHEAVTQDNEWYFRTTYTDATQAQFLVAYAHQILGYKSASVLYEDQLESVALARHLQEKAKQSGIEILSALPITPGLDQTALEDSVKAWLGSSAQPDIIFLAMSDSVGANTLKILRDAEVNAALMGSHVFSTEPFRLRVAQFPEEQNEPGFYLDSLYAARPFIEGTFGTDVQRTVARYSQEYNSPPRLIAGFTFDASGLLVHAMRGASLGTNSADLAQNRQKLRETLARYRSPESAYNGVFGPIFFNEIGDAVRSVSMVRYRNGRPVSAPTQLNRPLGGLNRDALPQLLESGSIVSAGDDYLLKTNLVYTGADILEVRSLDIESLSHEIVFDLWFRFSGNFDPAEIEFTNALGPIEMRRTATQFGSEGMTYHRYRAQGRFQTDYHPRLYAFGRHSVGIAFRHKTLNQETLAYIIDALGMGLSRLDSLTGSVKIAEKKQREKLINPSLPWQIERIFANTDRIETPTKGEPQYLGRSAPDIDFSRFNYELLIKDSGFTIRGQMPDAYVNWIFAAAVFITLFLLGLARRFRRHSSEKLRAIVMAATAFVILLCLEIIVISLTASDLSATNMTLITTMFDVLWWIVAAVAVNILMESFVWSPLERRTQRRIPQSVRGFVAMIVYVIAGLAIIAFVYDQKITSLLATSGVVAMIIGLAIQVNISNVFSGIVLNVERPFQIGDWVKVGDHEEGQVIEFTWRTTRIRTRDERVLSIPNNIAAETASKNFGGENDTYVDWFFLKIDGRYPPDEIKKIVFDAMVSVDRVIHGPDIFTLIGFAAITEWCNEYAVIFTARNYYLKYGTAEMVRTAIWEALDARGIRPAIRHQAIHMFEGQDAFANHESAAPATIETKAGEEITLLGDSSVYVMISGQAQIMGDANDNANAPRNITTGNILRSEPGQKPLRLVAQTDCRMIRILNP